MIIIKKEKVSLVSRMHPWIYKGSIRTITGNPENGDIVPVCTPEKKILGYGFYSPYSHLAVRVISFGPEELGKEWLRDRIHHACQLRQSLQIPSNGYRLINAEGDFIPGLIIDIYHRTVILRPLIKGIEIRLESLAGILEELYPGYSMYVRRDEYSARKERIGVQNGYIRNQGRGIEIIEENGLRFEVDIIAGQKTGFYLDLRDARILMASFCHNKEVLNLCAYTGAFAFHAAQGGAGKVVSVEQSKTALEIAQKNQTHNPDLAAEFEWIQDDLFDYLPGIKRTYDVIILDPPPFARRKQEVPGALKGYSFLNRKALQCLSPGGWLFTFSCSHAVGKDQFLQSLTKELIKAGRRARIMYELRPSPDHPSSVLHPEGDYLKGWALYVD